MSSNDQPRPYRAGVHDDGSSSDGAPPSAKQATGKLWGGRFSEDTDSFVEAFTASVTFDQRMAEQDIKGSIAHAAMLQKIGVLTRDELASIQQGLSEISEEIANGQFQWSIALEDVHMNIEARLTEKIGAAGKKLHTGRSRNDQVATDIRLYLRDCCGDIEQELVRLLRGYLELATQHTDTIMPGFTHLQSAQPVTFGHHVMAWFEMGVRDLDRLRDMLGRLDACPLGSAALAGTSYPIDRQMTADLLGFSNVCENSLDAVADRDFAIEFCSFASLTMMHLSRIAEELILWTSAQFRFVDLPDRYCTGSSIMPQKKNPDVAELVRGKTGRVYGNLTNLLTLMKGQPLTYNKDNQEDKEPLFDTIDTVLLSMRAFADMTSALQPNTKNMREAALQGFSTATDLADYLVTRGVPFRDAHEVVGKAVAMCSKDNKGLEDLSLQELKKLSPVIEEGVFDVLTLEGSVASRDHIGGTAPAQVTQAIARGHVRLAEFESA